MNMKMNEIDCETNFGSFVLYMTVCKNVCTLTIKLVQYILESECPPVHALNSTIIRRLARQGD